LEFKILFGLNFEEQRLFIHRVHQTPADFYLTGAFDGIFRYGSCKSQTRSQCKRVETLSKEERHADKEDAT
jgi:hypothetical protein